MNEIQQYIIEAAKSRGMDPNAVLRAVNSEGGTSDPFRQSDVITRGRREPSYGPLQLLIGGEGTGFPSGLGNAALAAGIDPRKDWKGGVDFALDTVAKEGWSQWYGPKNIGMGRWEGVKGAKPMGTTINSTPITVASGAPAPDLPPPTEVRDIPIADAATDDAPKDPMEVLKLLTTEGKEGAPSPLSKLASTVSSGSAAPQTVSIDPANALAASESSDAMRMQAGQSLMAQIMAARRKRVPGMSLMG